MLKMIEVRDWQTSYLDPRKIFSLSCGQAWETLIISQSQHSPHFAGSVALRKLIFYRRSWRGKRARVPAPFSLRGSWKINSRCCAPADRQQSDINWRLCH